MLALALCRSAPRKDAETRADLECLSVGESGSFADRRHFDFHGNYASGRAPVRGCFQRGQFFWNLRPHGEEFPLSKRGIQEMMGVSCWLPMREVFRFLFPDLQPAVPRLP